jgi:hypothetical protein
MLSRIPSILEVAIAHYAGGDYLCLRAVSRGWHARLSDKRSPLRPWLSMFARAMSRLKRPGAQNDVLTWACRNGYLPVAQWLASRYPLHYNYEMLWATRSQGRLAMVKWLVEYFKPSAKDVCADNRLVEYWGDAPNNIAIAEFLITHYRITRSCAIATVRRDWRGCNNRSRYLRIYLLNNTKVVFDTWALPH